MTQPKVYTHEEIEGLLKEMSPFWDSEEAYRDFEDENLTQKELDFIAASPAIISQLLAKVKELRGEVKKELEEIPDYGTVSDWGWNYKTP